MGSENNPNQTHEEFTQFCLPPVSVSQSCHDKVSQAGWFKRTKINFLTVMKTRVQD